LYPILSSSAEFTVIIAIFYYKLARKHKSNL